MQVRRPASAGVAATALLGTTLLWAQTALDLPLSALSLEELSNIEITSVSKRTERLSDAPTSIFVITSNDIRRAGVTNLPEALRLAPNLQVVRVNASDYYVSARGFNSSSANKLLVLIDGRSVYSPLFAGVFWDVQQVLLEDIERVEVISGPGGTLWGVNAVNGVINVITKSAAQTPDTLFVAAAGNREGRLGARYGGSTAAGLNYRIDVSRADQRHTKTAAGSVVNDTSSHTQVGFRADWAGDDDRLMLKSDTYTARKDPSSATPGLAPVSLSGVHLTGLWERQLGGGAAVAVQAYYDRTERSVAPIYTDTQQTTDLEARYTAGAIGAHTPSFGAELRHGRNHAGGGTFIVFLPPRVEQTWTSVYAQDEVALSDTLRLTLGLRAEHNDYTGTEFLPTARLAWKWHPDQLLWAAASRSVRAPSRLDRDTFVPSQPPYTVRGGPNFAAESAKDYELGYRGQLADGATLSATLFRTDYDKLRTLETEPGLTYTFLANGMQGRTSGFEVWGSYQATPAWRLHAGFSRLLQNLQLKPGSNDAASVAATEGANPPHWWSLRSALDIGRQTTLDIVVRRVAALSAPEVPAYTALDMRLGWAPQPGLELSLSGQNLTGGGHGEFNQVTTRSQFGRALLAKAEWRF